MHERALKQVIEDPAVGVVRSCLESAAGWIVGGAVRDALLGIGAGPDLDIAVDGDLGELLGCLGARARSHRRFGTASVEIGGRSIDLARTRAESYTHPGALPEVTPAGIEADLARRDFSISAIALPLEGGDLLDPHEGRADIAARRLRVLHPDSILDDPTRALRAGRYAARLDFEPDPETEAQIRAADLTTVSDDRIDAELALAASEPDPAAVAARLGGWGLFRLPSERVELIAKVARLGSRPPWARLVDRSRVLVPLLRGTPIGDDVRALARAAPGRTSEIRELGDRSAPESLLVALASGAEWVARWPEVRACRLAISGEDLIAAGVEPGPAIGIGLRTALRRRLDGEISAGAGAELAVALEAARANEGGQ